MSTTIAVHDGVMHADEVFAVATLKCVFDDVEVIRTRNEDLLAKQQFRVDVGRKYNPDTYDFDHHQEDFDVRHENPNDKKYEKGPKRSGFGLIWLNYGEKAVQNILNKEPYTNSNEEVVAFIYKNIDNSLVAAIDAFDNGENKEFYLDTGAYKMPSVISHISALNPSAFEEDYDPNISDKNFQIGVDFAKQYLIRAVLREYFVIASMDTVIEKVKEAAADGINWIIFNRFVPWYQAFKKCVDESKCIDFVIFKRDDNQWMMQPTYFNYHTDKERFTPSMADGSRRRLKYPAPKNICGKVNEELQQITGIEDAIFCHTGGFIASAGSCKGALKLAKYFMEHQDN
jgi:uncharacterized UPF0160 family protein